MAIKILGRSRGTSFHLPYDMDRPRHTKHDSSASTSFSLLSPVRRRRTVCLFIVLITLICVFGVPWELPAALKDEAGLSRGNVVTLAKRPAAEIFGLLHLVTRSERGGLDGPHAAAAATTRGGAAPLLDPAQPIALSVYAGGVTDEEADWPGVVEGLNEQFPVVVFSKASFLILCIRVPQFGGKGSLTFFFFLCSFLRRHIASEPDPCEL
jgi:hypothetical protein